MKLLITTEPDDTHALLVKAALEKIGHEVRLLFTADQPTKQKNSVYIDNATYDWTCTDKYSHIKEENYDVVWWRRARKPHITKGDSHPDDYFFIMRENHLFFESITDNLAPKAWWINPKKSSKLANSKLVQLRLANQCGMTIPTTLCSNNPKDIREFLLKNDKEGVIYKPLCSHYWMEENQVKIVYTSKVNFEDLPGNRILQLVPGIFQKEIKKKYELRVTCFGEYIVAAKINSQFFAEGKMDWRVIPQNKLMIEPYVLPTQLEKQIRLFLKKLGLVFGALDFIVTPENDYVFLEVNEQGQFLWIEDCNQDFKMLDIFVNFILNQSVHFEWNPKKVIHTVTDYEAQIENVLMENLDRHVNLNRSNLSI